MAGHPEKKERNRRIVQLRRDGWTCDRIAHLMGISAQRVHAIWKRDKHRE